jgi:hypothetical protein
MGGWVVEGNPVIGTDFVRLVGTLAVVLLALPVCAVDKYPDYPVPTAASCSVKAERAGLTVGVLPLENLQEQKTYFRAELTPKGFIPVFLVIENGSAADSFLFDKTNIGYAGVSGNATPNGASRAGEKMAMVGLGGLIAMKLIANATEVQENILKKEVQSRTLSPGASTHGFLYIPVPKKGARDTIHLQVPITKAGTSETFVLNLLF